MGRVPEPSLGRRKESLTLQLAGGEVWSLGRAGRAKEEQRSRTPGSQDRRTDGEERAGEQRGPPCTSHPRGSDGGWALSLEPGSRSSSAAHGHNRSPL